MEHTDIYYLILDKIKDTHNFFVNKDGNKYELYKQKLEVVYEIEDYAKNKLRLNELFEIKEMLRVAKINCQLKMNHYYQIKED